MYLELYTQIMRVCVYIYIYVYMYVCVPVRIRVYPKAYHPLDSTWPRNLM